MDPTTILSVVNVSAGLTIKCGNVIQALYELAQRYKQAELTILSVIEECHTIQLAWTRIEEWATQNLVRSEEHDELLERLQRSLYTGQLVMCALEKDLSSMQNIPQFSNFRRRTKIVWNERVLQDHQNRLHAQIGALTLLLEVLSL